MIETRLAETRDYEAWTVLWRRYLDFYDSSRPMDVYRSSWSKILDPNSKMYSALAFHDGQAVGLVNFLYHASFWEITDRCYLNDLYVSTSHRGGGVGERLIRLVKNHAEEQGASQVYWLTAQDNEPARKLYDRVARLTPFVKYQC